MKKLVAYATKYGMTGEYARAMASAMGKDARLLDTASREVKNLDLSEYGTVVLGSSVYAGRAWEDLRTFIKKNAVELRSKDLVLFLCGVAEEGNESLAVLNGTFPEALRVASRKTAYLPGWVDLEKTNGFERFVVRMIEKADAKKGKKPISKPDIRTEAAVFIRECGL